MKSIEVRIILTIVMLCIFVLFPCYAGSVITEPDGFRWIYDRTYKKECALDVNGKKLIPKDNYLTIHYSKGFFLCTMSTEGFPKCVFTKEGRKVINASKGYENICMIYDRDGNPYFYVTNKKHKNGLIDANGKIIIPIKYDLINNLNEGFECISFNKEIYRDTINFSKHNPIIDGDIIKYRYKDYDGYVYYLLNKKYGYYGVENELGKTIVPLGYYRIRRLSEIQCFLTEKYSNGKYCYCVFNQSGDSIIPASRKYESVSYYNVDGLKYFSVKRDNKEGICNLWGEELFPPNDFERIEIKDVKETDYKYWVKKDNKVGIFTKEGRELIPPLYYDEIRWKEHYGFYVVKQGNKEGICDLKGRLIIPAIYENLYYDDTHGFHIEVEGYYIELGIKLNHVHEPYVYTVTNEPWPTYKTKMAIEAEMRAQEKAERRQQRLERLAMALHAMAGAANNMMQGMQSYQYQRTGFGRVGNQSGMDYLLDPNYIKVQYLQETRNGTTMTFNQWLNLKAPMYGGSSSNTESGPTSSSSGTSSSSSSSSAGRLCPTCKGDGRCIGCHGSGLRTDNEFGTGVDPSKICGVCNGRKTCNSCQGSGYK